MEKKEVVLMHKPDFKEARTMDKRQYITKKFSLNKKYQNYFQGKTYFLKTYGCQMNEHDSENIEAILKALGFQKEDDYEKADLILLNTCSIRENAHNKAFGMLGRCKHLKEKRPDLMVGLCGCMAQEETVVASILENFSWLNFVVGTHNFNEIPALLVKSLEEGLQVEVYSREKDLVEGMPTERQNPFKAYVNIIYGCDKFCTYCIVPYTRGRQRSRKKEDILEEIQKLLEDGYKEITLLGQNVNAYGKDLYENYSFGELLEDVAQLNVPRIRFVTSHPWDFTDHMIEVIATHQNIMPSIHLPVQSGSNRILKLMGRRYTKESYLELVQKLKAKIPHLALSTDIIVGFPTETEEDFQETMDIVEQCQYDNAFTFIYSIRHGTPAEKIKEQVPLEIKEERLQRLNEKVNFYFLKNNQALVGKTLKVLTEGKSLKQQDAYFGYTETNKLVNFTGENIQLGDFVDVEITEAKTWSLDGQRK